MRIKRDVDTNKPIVKSYLSQVEGETTNYYQFSIQSHKELTLLVDEKVMETDPLFLHPITLATFKRFPPLQLTIRVQSSTYLSASIITHSSKEILSKRQGSLLCVSINSGVVITVSFKE